MLKLIVVREDNEIVYVIRAEFFMNYAVIVRAGTMWSDIVQLQCSDWSTFRRVAYGRLTTILRVQWRHYY